MRVIRSAPCHVGGRGRSRFGFLAVAGLLLAVWLAAQSPPGSAAVAAGQSRSPAGSTDTRAALHVIPFPGTPDASPQSEVIFSSLATSDLRSVAVQGSHSGSHSGHIVALPDGAGSAFMPDRRFDPGEEVNVTALLSSPDAGTRSGDPGATVLRFSFAIAVPATPSTTASPPRPGGGVARDTVSGATTQHFRSQVNFHPPAVTFGPDPDTSSGEIFLTPFHVSQSGPMIIDRQGHLVWFYPLHDQARNLEMQMYHGHRVLTWWQGKVYGNGPRHQHDVIMDRSYHTVAIVRAGHGYRADDHEFQITPQGTALLDAYVWTKANLSSVGGPQNGRVIEGVIQEIDIKTGQVLWEWHSLGHIPLSASYDRPAGSGAYDYCHMNSIQQMPDGDLLTSCRNTWAIYLISKRTGHVIWKLGGKYSGFTMGQGTRFEWQHDARLSGQTLTLFNDAFDGAPGHQEAGESSAKVLHIDTSTRRVTLVHAYNHSPPLLSSSQGNTQTLPDHNIFVGWGNQPNFSEYTPAGSQIFNGSLPLGVDSYRAFRFVWAGHPTRPPTMAIEPQGGGALKVYASWNGATRVISWRVVGGANRGSRHFFRSRPRTGFETVLTIHRRPRYLEVQALDRHGHVLGTSLPHPTCRCSSPASAS